MSLLIDCPESAWLEQVDEEGWKGLLVPAAVETFRQTAWNHDAVLSCLLTNDETIRELNATYRKKDKATNVLSFPLLEFSQPLLPKEAGFEYNQLGDVVLAFETVRRESLELGLSIQDHSVHLFVHSVLHLLGYDHEEEAEACVMENLESSILVALGRRDPYARERRIEARAGEQDHI